MMTDEQFHQCLLMEYIPSQECLRIGISVVIFRRNFHKFHWLLEISGKLLIQSHEIS